MIINKLKLHNFKSYADTEIEFNTGLSIIMGANGAGKSTILEAISFALYKDYSSRSLKDLILKEKDKMKIELEFQNNGKTYLVIRKKGKSSSQAELYEKENDKYFPITQGDNPVNAEIKNLMNMDKDLFLNAVYVRQGEIANLINKNQSEKKRLISKLLGIDSLEKAWENIRFIIKDYETEEAEYKGKIEAMGDLKKELEDETKQKIEYQTKIDNNEKEINIIKEEISKLEEEDNKLDLLNSKLQETDTKIKNNELMLSIEKSNNTNNKNKLKEIIESKEKIKLIQPKINQLEKLEKLNKSFEKIKNLEQPKNMFENNIKEINNYEQIKNNNLPYYEEYLEIEKKIEDINDKLIQYSKLQTQEKTYNSQKEEYQKNIDKLEKEIKIIFQKGNSLLKTQHENITDFEKSINDFIKNNELKINELKDNVKIIENKNSELNVENRNLNKSLKELSSINKKCPVCNSDISEAKKSELSKEYKTNLNNNIKQIQENKKRYDSFKKEINALEIENKNINSINIELLKDKLDNLEKEKNEIKKNEKEHKEILNKIYELNDIESEKTSKTERLNEIKNNYNQFITAENNLKTKNIEDEKNKLQKVIQQINSCKLDIKTIFNELGSEYSQNEVSDKLIEYSKIKDEYNKLLGKIEDQKIYEENIKKSESKIKEIENEIKTLKDILSNISYDATKHKTLKNLIINKTDNLNNIIGNQQKDKGILIGIEEKIKKIEIRIVDYDKYNTKLVKIKESIKLLNTIRKIYSKDGVQKILRSESLPLIEYHTNKIFKDFNFDYSGIELDDDYNIQLFGPSGETSLDMMSGGEKIAIALALRLGITNTLSGNLEMIMLDEPTIHLDDYRRHELVEILKNLNLLPQMIIVTHDNDLEEAADNIFKIEKIDGISTVKQE